jgi:hypothetical protein
MEMIILAFAASTMALVVLPLVDYVVDEDTVITRKVVVPHASPPGGAFSAHAPQVHYDRAA